MKMVEALQRQGNRLAGGVAPANGGRVIGYMITRVAGRRRTLDCTDACEQHAQTLPDAFDFWPSGDRRGETKLVIVTAGQHILLLNVLLQCGNFG